MSGDISLTIARQTILWNRDARALTGINSWRARDILSGGFGILPVAEFDIQVCSN